jgi:prepilin-type N-terminal cleavage/methylation domain
MCAMERAQTGVTLIELMVALMVLAILLGVAVPSFAEFTRSNRATAAQNDLVTAFNLARSEALRTSAPVSVCPSADGASCGGVNDWASGWIVFTDATGAPGVVDGTDQVLQAWSGVRGGIILTATAVPQSNALYRQYQPTGTVRPATALRFDVHWSGCTGRQLRRLTVSPIGTLQATREDCT